MSSRRRGSPSGTRERAAATRVANQKIAWPREHPIVKALFHRFSQELQWPTGAPDSVRINWAHVMAQALAPLHFGEREETPPAPGGGSHAALPAPHGKGLTTASGEVTPSPGGGGVPPTQGTTSKGDLVCLQTQLMTQINHLHNEIVALRQQVIILQAHLTDFTGYVAVAVNPQLDTSLEHPPGAWHEHPSGPCRSIAQDIRAAQHAAVVRSRSNSVGSTVEEDILAAQQTAKERSKRSSYLPVPDGYQSELSFRPLLKQPACKQPIK